MKRPLRLRRRADNVSEVLYSATGTIKAINFRNLLFKVKSLNELSKPSRCD